MPALNSVVVRDVMSQLTKRSKSWPQREPGVMVVFCIVGVVAIFLGALFISKHLKARKLKRGNQSTV